MSNNQWRSHYINVMPIENKEGYRTGFRVELFNGGNELLKSCDFKRNETSKAKRLIQKYMVEPVPRIEWTRNDMGRTFWGSNFTATEAWSEIEL